MLLDTSGLLCLQHASEVSHLLAKRLFVATSTKLTHSYVLAEYLALVTTRRLPRGQALKFIRHLPEHPDVEVVWVDKALHDRALRLLSARSDKTYSLCDAVSFILMRDRGIQEALTTDRHFVQEGFRRLLDQA